MSEIKHFLKKVNDAIEDGKNYKEYLKLFSEFIDSFEKIHFDSCGIIHKELDCVFFPHLKDLEEINDLISIQSEKFQSLREMTCNEFLREWPILIGLLQRKQQIYKRQRR